ncbi:DUF6247 family protein [Actinomadura alba]|uniref:DUF6247 family protein n=1 Tax=Actinomadura alba TaxID=406431 RepID=UPI001FECECE1|nr:DUF6247 family protein [Actinomadura alba]
MTAQPNDFAPGSAPEPAKSLRAIRAALVVPQDRGAFDAGLKAVLDEVRVNLDLGVLNDFVHRWWISACDSHTTPKGVGGCTPAPVRSPPGKLSLRDGRGVSSSLSARTDGRCTGSTWTRSLRNRSTRSPRELYARSPSCSRCWRRHLGAGSRSTLPIPGETCSRTPSANAG